MRIDPQIAALRSDKALRRRCETAMLDAKRAWCADEATSQLLQELERFGDKVALEQLPCLAALLSEPAKSKQFVENWSAHFTQELRSNPLGQIPFRHQYSPGFAMMQLASAGRAVLSVLVYEQLGDNSPPQSVTFSDRELFEIVLSGEAKARLFQYSQRSNEPLKSSQQKLAAGSARQSAGRGEARQIFDVKGCLVMLQLARVPASPAPTREIAIADGALLLQSCGEKRTSQNEMALAVLGAMGREDAAPIASQMSAEGPDHLRWQALRQALHLDPIAGFEALSHIADSAKDELQGAASSLRNALIQTYPQLAR